MYSGTKHFRPTESQCLFGHLGRGYRILTKRCHICCPWRETGPGEQGAPKPSGLRPVWRDKNAEVQGVLKVSILLQTWFPLGLSMREEVLEGAGLLSSWKGRCGTEGGWTAAICEHLVSELQAGRTGRHCPRESPQVSMAPALRPRRQRVSILFLRGSCNDRHCSKTKKWELALSRPDEKAGCFLRSLGPVSPSDFTKQDKATSRYLLQSNFWQLHESESEGKVR